MSITLFLSSFGPFLERKGQKKTKRALTTSKLRLELFYAGSADSFAVKENDVVGVIAEYAGGLILLKNDLVFVF